MCGILGHWSKVRGESFDWFERSLNQLGDRGPDDQGQEILDHRRLALGHTRLAIIDTSSAGRQPLTNTDGSLWITFNGEIYNYKALRTELTSGGHCFRTNTDTEVIVHAYREWGRDCVQRLRGIFAFAVWDEAKEQLFLARDHVGVKPLYFARTQQTFTFASQPKAIASMPSFSRSVCPDAFRDYLSFGYVPDPGCIFQGIEKLPPGHCLEVTRDSIRKTRYWELKYNPTITKFSEATEAIGAAVAKSVEAQLVSDVPVGALLSGGIDSTLLTGIACSKSNPEFGRFKTFTLGFDEPGSDERKFAKIAAEFYQTDHYVDELSRADLSTQLDDVICSFDEPFDPNGPLPATRIAQLVRRNNTKVVVGGDGGDELFSGYLRYDEFAGYINSISRTKRLLGKMFRKKGQRAAEAAEYFRHEGACTVGLLAAIMPDCYSRDWLSRSMADIAALYDPNLPATTACQLVDFHHYLPGHILTKVDRASMHNGVEVRVPLLDLELAELAFRISSDINYRNHERKAAFKAAATRYVPTDLLTGRKKGFSCPMQTWSDDAFIEKACEKISSGIMVASGLVRGEAAVALMANRSTTSLRILWLLLTAELWAEKWLESGSVRT